MQGNPVKVWSSTCCCNPFFHVSPNERHWPKDMSSISAYGPGRRTDQGKPEDLPVTHFFINRRTGLCGYEPLFIKPGFRLWLALMCLTSQVMAQNPQLTDTLQEVVVTATGTQHLLKNVPVQTEVITSKMLQRYGGSSFE